MGELCTIKSCDHITYANGVATTPSRKTKNDRKKGKKLSGYGTALISKLANGIELKKYDGDFEIVYCILNLNGITGAIFTGYRSPSMRSPDIEKYYSALTNLIGDVRRKNDCSFIIFVGDDNSSEKSSSHYSRVAAKNLKMVADKHMMIDLIPGINTRGNHQPDSCLAYFDPEKVEICANLLAGLAATGSDHEMIQISIKRSKIIAEPLKFKKMKRLKCVVTPQKMETLLENALDAWSEKWRHEIKKDMTQKTLNKATQTLIEKLNQVKNLCYEKQLRLVHKDAKSDDNDENLNILRLRGLVSKFAWQIKLSPKNVELRQKLLDVNNKLEKAIQTAAIKKLNDDMKKQMDVERKNDTSFWQLTGSLVNKSAYQTSINKKMTKTEIGDKLDFYDTTFINLSPDFSPNLNSFENIRPEKTYTLNDDCEFIESLIERINEIMSKITERISQKLYL
jgi:hypothetical protein